MFFVLILCNVFAIAAGLRTVPWTHIARHFQVDYKVTRAQPLFAVPEHKVTIQHNGVTTSFQVHEDVSILDAALEVGLELPHDCKLGVCLTCPSKLISGKLDQSGTTLDDSVVERGYALMCMSFPLSDVVMSTIDEEELVEAQFSGRT